jgi:hypothetical protein
LGHNAGELIAPWAIAIAARMSVKHFASAVFPYPTVSEAAKRAAIAFYTPKLQSRPVRWALRFARLLG